MTDGLNPQQTREIDRLQTENDQLRAGALGRAVQIIEALRVRDDHDTDSGFLCRDTCDVIVAALDESMTYEAADRKALSREWEARARATPDVELVEAGYLLRANPDTPEPLRCDYDCDACRAQPVTRSNLSRHRKRRHAREAAPTPDHEPWCYRRHTGDCVDGPSPADLDAAREETT